MLFHTTAKVDHLSSLSLDSVASYRSAMEQVEIDHTAVAILLNTDAANILRRLGLIEGKVCRKYRIGEYMDLHTEA